MKRPLEWHKQCLLNQKKHLNELKRELDKAQNNYDRCLNSTLFYIEQVETAENERKDSFDPDKYLKQRQK